MPNLAKGAQEKHAVSANAIDKNSDESLLHDGELLDFVDYTASSVAVSLALTKEMIKTREFAAATTAYCSSSAHLTLGYSGFFCWPAIHAVFKEIAEEELLDCVRIAAYCNGLAAIDQRHVALDYNAAHERFPILFQIENISFPGPERSDYLSSLSDEMRAFAVKHAFRAAHFSAVKSNDEDEYIQYWMSHAKQRLSKHLQNQRFLAGLDAFSQEILSFHGFLEKVFGQDYYNNVLKENQYAIFHDLRGDLTARVLVKLAREIQSGQRQIAPDLRSQFPEVYEFYQPELYGARP